MRPINSIRLRKEPAAATLSSAWEENVTEAAVGSDAELTRLSFRPGGTEIEAIARALAPEQPIFIYERAPLNN